MGGVAGVGGNVLEGVGLSGGSAVSSSGAATEVGLATVGDVTIAVVPAISAVESRANVKVVGGRGLTASGDGEFVVLNTSVPSVNRLSVRRGGRRLIPIVADVAAGAGGTASNVRVSGVVATIEVVLVAVEPARVASGDLALTGDLVTAVGRDIRSGARSQRPITTSSLGIVATIIIGGIDTRSVGTGGTKATWAERLTAVEERAIAAAVVGIVVADTIGIIIVSSDVAGSQELSARLLIGIGHTRVVGIAHPGDGAELKRSRDRVRATKIVASDVKNTRGGRVGGLTSNTAREGRLATSGSLIAVELGVPEAILIDTSVYVALGTSTSIRAALLASTSSVAIVHLAGTEGTSVGDAVRGVLAANRANAAGGGGLATVRDVTVAVVSTSDA